MKNLLGISALALGLGLFAVPAFAQEAHVVDGDVVVSGDVVVGGSVESASPAGYIDYEEYVSTIEPVDSGPYGPHRAPFGLKPLGVAFGLVFDDHKG